MVLISDRLRCVEQHSCRPRLVWLKEFPQAAVCQKVVLNTHSSVSRGHCMPNHCSWSAHCAASLSLPSRSPSSPLPSMSSPSSSTVASVGLSSFSIFCMPSKDFWSLGSRLRTEKKNTDFGLTTITTSILLKIRNQTKNELMVTLVLCCTGPWLLGNRWQPPENLPAFCARHNHSDWPERSGGERSLLHISVLGLN